MSDTDPTAAPSTVGMTDAQGAAGASDATEPRAWASAWGATAVVRPAAPTVDAHTHLMVPAAAELVAPHVKPEADPRTFYSSAETTALNAAFYREAKERFTDPAARLRDMDAMGIDVQMVAVSPLQYYYWADEALAERVAALQNEHIAEVVAAAPKRFSGVATLPLAHPHAAVAEARRVASSFGFRAVQFGADVAGLDLDEPRFEPVWDALEELGLVVILHPAGFTEARRLTDYYLVNVIGMPLSSTLAVTRMILGGVLERHRGLRLLVVHGGGYLTSYAARTDHAFRHRPELRHHIDRLPSEYLREIHVDTTVFDPEIVARLVRDHGSDRVHLGTDYPFDMGETDPLALIAAAGLAQDDHLAVVGGNSARLFGLAR
jgi:aminocarboxymuconate-semialdehyde decarboxylase